MIEEEATELEFMEQNLKKTKELTEKMVIYYNLINKHCNIFLYKIKLYIHNLKYFVVSLIV